MRCLFFFFISQKHNVVFIFTFWHFYKDCGLLTSPTNGKVTLPEVTSEGQTAVYSCNVGFALNDVTKEIRECLSTGEWSLSAPLCVVGGYTFLFSYHYQVEMAICK